MLAVLVRPSRIDKEGREAIVRDKGLFRGERLQAEIGDFTALTTARSKGNYQDCPVTQSAQTVADAAFQQLGQYLAGDGVGALAGVRPVAVCRPLLIGA